ncbi:hypothetical protein EIP91_002738 [Steccherinum ochraceum]|uniref:Uncharacterized protein n=1 Tax=Steccherinum ochraceum TaxID=92696 RepID=A0A4R0RSB7_9APHY|nr:hypothetical protein EIP91_002738 [Steccherinum ochraceum]
MRSKKQRPQIPKMASTFELQEETSTVAVKKSSKPVSTSRHPLTRSRSCMSRNEPTKDLECAKIDMLATTMSAKLNENARRKSKHLEKQKSKKVVEGSVSKRRAVSRAHSEETAGTNSSSPSKLSARPLPSMSSFPSTSSGSADTQTPWPFCAPNTPDVALMNVDSRPRTPERREPSIPVPAPAPPLPTTFVGSTTSSSRVQSSAPPEPLENPPPPALRRRQEQAPAPSGPQPRANLPTSKPLNPKAFAPSQRISQVRASQPTMPRSTPPPLGMRRAHTTGSTVSGLVSRGLPTKQAGFKPPFARPPAVANTYAPQANRQMSASTTTHHANTIRTISSARHATVVVQPRSPSPEAPVDADSSYGELPFDMADLDEAMKQYDD